MSRFSEGLKIIPRTAWYVAGFLEVGFATLALTVFIPSDREMSHWPLPGKLAFAFGLILVVAAWVLLIGYVYADAKRRGMRYVAWTWLTLIPYGIGVIVYFILRDPLPRPCPGCGTVVKSGFVFCPHCGTATTPRCPNCGHTVEYGWANCPECGSKLPAVTSASRVA